MANQVLFYENANPITKERHRDWFVETGHDYSFAQKTNSVPLTAVEFPSAGREYAIVFAGANEGTTLPVAILGMADAQNLYLTAEGGWKASYIPAFVRRYPFIFATDGEGKTFTLCIDEGFAGCNQEGQGRPLFDDEGGRTDYLEGVLKFLQEYQVQHQRTQAFIKRLRELNLLEPMQANVALKSGKKHSIAGFQVVSRDKLNALSADAIHDLFKSGALELIYTHLQSLANFGAMVDRLSGHRQP
ncbi:MAG: SapC family protein [Gammaproteobacteria bacterium]|nr:SapC family protein [Gammaproteobacteria bacterium]